MCLRGGGGGFAARVPVVGAPVRLRLEEVVEGVPAAEERVDDLRVFASPRRIAERRREAPLQENLREVPDDRRRRRVVEVEGGRLLRRFLSAGPPVIGGSPFFGVPLRFEKLKEIIEGQKRSEAYRRIAKTTQQAVEALRDGDLLDLEAPDPTFPEEADRRSTLAVLMDDLQGRYVSGTVDKPVTFYFSISDAKEGKWNLLMEPEHCRLGPGRPEGGRPTASSRRARRSSPRSSRRATRHPSRNS